MMASGLPLKSSDMLSVVANPVQVAVTVVAAAPEEIAPVPSATDPLQIVCVKVPGEFCGTGTFICTVPNAPVTGSMVSNPLVAFPKVREPSVPDAPSVGVAVKAGDAPFST